MAAVAGRRGRSAFGPLPIQLQQNAHQANFGTNGAGDGVAGQLVGQRCKIGRKGRDAVGRKVDDARPHQQQAQGGRTFHQIVKIVVFDGDDPALRVLLIVKAVDDMGRHHHHAARRKGLHLAFHNHGAAARAHQHQLAKTGVGVRFDHPAAFAAALVQRFDIDEPVCAVARIAIQHIAGHGHKAAAAGGGGWVGQRHDGSGEKSC